MQTSEVVFMSLDIYANQNNEEIFRLFRAFVPNNHTEKCIKAACFVYYSHLRDGYTIDFLNLVILIEEAKGLCREKHNC